MAAMRRRSASPSHQDSCQWRLRGAKRYQSWLKFKMNKFRPCGNVADKALTAKDGAVQSNHKGGTANKSALTPGEACPLVDHQFKGSPPSSQLSTFTKQHKSPKSPSSLLKSLQVTPSLLSLPHPSRRSHRCAFMHSTPRRLVGRNRFVVLDSRA